MEDKNYITVLVVGLVMIIVSLLIKFNEDRYDVNRDGIVNAQDYTEIKNYIMNRED